MTNSDSGMLFGHPKGLYVLFFAEMWERFSYYGMRALLVFYMIKGFLGYGDKQAYSVYGAYTAMVYMTPFFGGMLADKLLGSRRAVILGGLLMAAGHLVMGVESEFGFFVALALLIAGNGFFKPNISTMVGELYPTGSPKRDGGFTIFYMGINLGAAMAPLACGYIGETYGWHYGFRLATGGMMVGLAVFVMPSLVTQILIMSGAIASAVSLLMFRPDNVYSLMLNGFVATCLVAAAVASWFALRGGSPLKDVGHPPSPQRLRRRLLGVLPVELAVYLATFVSIPLFALLACGFSPLTEDGKGVVLISQSYIDEMVEDGGALEEVVAVVLAEISKPAGMVLGLAGIAALIYLGTQFIRLNKIARHRMQVAMILIFFSMLFWAFFEQAGSSVNNFTDRNVDRVAERRLVSEDEVGSTIRLQPTQEQLGYVNGDTMFTMTSLDGLRKEHEGTPGFEVDWVVAPDNVGMGIATRNDEIPASTIQAANPVFILTLGLGFTAMWTFLAKRKIEPNTPVKFAMGLVQLGLGFGVFWYAADTANERGMALMSLLLLGYLLQTTGELCLSPVGLSMITKLSPMHLVSTMMGTWFLATAFSQYLAAIIAQFTGVSHGGGGETVGVPIPSETVHVYGDVFGKIAIAAIISGLICLILSPWLRRWMHEEVVDDVAAHE